jgi:hypothetical protein
VDNERWSLHLCEPQGDVWCWVGYQLVVDRRLACRAEKSPAELFMVLLAVAPVGGGAAGARSGEAAPARDE